MPLSIPQTVELALVPVARNIAVMELTVNEIAMVEQFRQTLAAGDTTVDFYLTVEYFRALGLPEGAAHWLAEHVSTSDEPAGR